MKNVFFYDTKYGRIAVSDNGSEITDICFENDMDASGMRLWETELIRNAGKRINEYLEGRRRNFDLPLEPEGTDFQKAVWKETMKIPYGETATYKEIAERIGRPNSYRAVGGAVGKNPILILIPCHRIISSDGSTGNYIGGEKMKEELIEMERMRV